MRTASLDQSSPTADPKITVTVGGQTYNTEGTGADATQRVMRVLTDEQAWGSVYIVLLDNSDETLNGLSLEGLTVTLNMTFVGQTADNFPPMKVLFQEHTSEEGKLLLKLTCVDEWTLLEATETTYTGAQFNQPWQTATELDARYMPNGTTLVKDVPALYDDLLANGNKTAWGIIQYLMAAAGATVAVGDTDSYINTLKPPLQVSNVRSGIRQALDTTACYLKLHTDGIFRPYNPSLHATVYTFSTLDLFYTNAHEAMATIPNRIEVWAYNETGSAWLNGTADDSDSQTALGRVVPRHYYIATLDSEVTRTQAELDTMAEGILAKVQHEGAQGEIVAPMHVSLELFDKVAVTDSRYTPSRTIEGYVHRIQREYDRGIYRIKIFLGGVTGGYTAPGGQDPGGLVDTEKPKGAPTISDFDFLPAYLPVVIDIVFTGTAWNEVSWGAGTIKAANGDTWVISSGSLTLANDNVYYLYYDVEADTGHLSNTQTFTNTVSTERILVGFLRRADSIDGEPLIVIGSQGKDLFVDVLSAITANLGLINAGEIRLGTGDLNAGTYTGWRLWLEDNIGRMAGFQNGGVAPLSGMHWYSGTDGKLYAAGGKLQIHSGGVEIEGDPDPDPVFYFKFRDDLGDEVGMLGTVGKVFYCTAVPQDGRDMALGASYGMVDLWCRAESGYFVRMNRTSISSRLKIPVGTDMYD